VPETLAEPRRLAFSLKAAVARRALLPALIVACVMLTYGAQVSFLPFHAQALGANPGLFFLVFALVVAMARAWTGRLSDWVGRVPVTVAGLILTAVALVLLALARDARDLALLGALYGLGLGTALPPLVAWCVDVVDATERGRAMATYYIALELGIATGAMSSGLLVSAFGVRATFLAPAVDTAIAAAWLLAQRPTPSSKDSAGTVR